MKTLKTLFACVAIALFTLSISIPQAFSQKVKGNHNVVIKERSILSFEKVEISGGYSIILSQNEKESLKVETDENLQEYIISEVVGNTLKIYTKDDVSITDNSKMKLYISVKNLKYLEISGAVDLENDTKINLDELVLNISGASSIKLSDLVTNKLKLDFSGASNVKWKGSANEVNAEMSGATDFDAYDFEAQSFKIDISGTGNAKIHVSKKLIASISGIGTIKYKGNPEVVQKDSNFLGSIQKVK